MWQTCWPHWLMMEKLWWWRFSACSQSRSYQSLWFTDDVLQLIQQEHRVPNLFRETDDEAVINADVRHEETYVEQVQFLYLLGHTESVCLALVCLLAAMAEACCVRLPVWLMLGCPNVTKQMCSRIIQTQTETDVLDWFMSEKLIFQL